MPVWGPSGPPQSHLLVLRSLHTQSLGAGLACGLGDDGTAGPTLLSVWFFVSVFVFLILYF